MDLKSIKTNRGAVVSIHNGAICTTNLFDAGWMTITDPSLINELNTICCEIKTYGEIESVQEKIRELKNNYNSNILDYGEPYRRARTSSGSSTPRVARVSMAKPIKLETEIMDEETGEVSTEIVEDSEEVKKEKTELCKKIIEFFKEFNFTPGFRFVNNFGINARSNKAKEYVANYFRLQDKPEVNDVIEKMKSVEFTAIVESMKSLFNKVNINNRLEIYFGSQGTGKTTYAQSKYPSANVIVCNNCMLPSDLMEDFDFNDENGNPCFKESALQCAMKEGKPIILDEFNLLVLDSLRFLQGILDNKEKIIYKGEEIEIKPGFKIIGTMNLVVNNCVFALPEPLVDRAEIIKEFNVDAKVLACAI